MKKSIRTLFSLPYIILMVVFVILPLLIIVYYSLTTPENGFTFRNFTSFFTDTYKLRVLLRSLGYALLTSVICFLIAYPIALILSNKKLNKSSLLVLVFILPMWINSLLRLYAVRETLMMMHIGLGFSSVIIGLVYDFFPFMLLPIYTILSSIDHSYVEAANDLGASPIQTFLSVKLPLSLPGIVSGFLMVFMPTVSNFAIKDMLGNADNYLFGNMINEFFQQIQLRNQGAAMAIIMLGLVALTMAVASLLTNGKARPGGSLF